MRTPSSVKRNIVLSLFILFAIGFASLGSIGGRVHAATLHPLKPYTLHRCYSPYLEPCIGVPGDAFAFHLNAGGFSPPGADCTFTWSLVEDHPPPPHSTGTFNPPTTHNDESTTLTIQTSRDTPEGFFLFGFKFTSSQCRGTRRGWVGGFTVNLCPAGTTPSGVSWVGQFPDSSSIADLAEPFRSNVNRFLSALSQAGALIGGISTYRPPQRAYLMHYAFTISRGADPWGVPSMAGVPICWKHTRADGSFDLVQSRAAAEQMVRAYNIAYEPALTSNHTQRLAIDMTISWRGTLRIMDANGRRVTISTPPQSGLNPTLWQVGRTYGVIKLASDPPHWSYNGR